MLDYDALIPSIGCDETAKALVTEFFGRSLPPLVAAALAEEISSAMGAYGSFSAGVAYESGDRS